MSEIMQFLERAFPPLILVFTLANLGGFVLAPIAARIFGKLAGKTVAGDTI